MSTIQLCYSTINERNKLRIGIWLQQIFEMLEYMYSMDFLFFEKKTLNMYVEQAKNSIYFVLAVYLIYNNFCAYSS